MSKKAIIFDLDGTAVDSPGQKLPSVTLVREIRRLEDVYYFCAATGRVWTFAKPVLQALELHDPCIISAGTQICDPQTGKILWQRDIDGSALRDVISIFQKYPDWKLLHNDGTEDDYFHGGVFPSEFANNEPVYFLEQVFIPNEIAQKISEELNTVNGVAVVSVVSQKPDHTDIHIVNSSATKEHAIAQLFEMLHVKKEDSIGIGDGYNDIHLFNAVGYKVAMGNAVPGLKELADIVIKPAHEDGLANYLETL